jgi:zinc protease
MGFWAGFSRAGVIAFLIASALRPAFAQQDPKIFQFALQNGMQVVVVPDHRAPIVTQMLWYRVGATDDPPGLSGLAHFFEHMMFRGTATAPGDQFSRTVARNGGEENAFTTHDYTAFYEQIAKDRLKLVMGLDADRMANLDLSDPNVRTERDVVLEERRMRIDGNPQSLMREQMDAALFLSHPYGRPVIGWPEEIRRIGRIEAQDYYERHYSPNNCILVVAGDVTTDEVRNDAEATYGKVPARALRPRPEYAQPARLGETRLTVYRDDVKVPILVRLYRVPSYTEARPGAGGSCAIDGRRCDVDVLPRTRRQAKARFRCRRVLRRLCARRRRVQRLCAAASGRTHGRSGTCDRRDHQELYHRAAIAC